MLITVYCVVLGLIIGSAINAVVWRLYVGRSWAKGRSMCPDCNHTLAAKDLVPVFSWLVLRGKCRYCGKRIHWQYPVVEGVTAGLFGLSAAVLAPVTALDGVRLALWLMVLVLLVILAVYDTRWMILPDKVMVPAMIVAVGYIAFMATVFRSWDMVRGPVEAAIVFGGAFLTLFFVTRQRGMGMGDVKLVFLMGLLLGLRGTALALFVAFDVAAIVGLVLIALRRKGRRDYLPFGPFLIGATVVAFLYGKPIVDWYLQINGLI